MKKSYDYPVKLSSLKKDLGNLKDLERGKFLAGFFKTGKGQYAEGDIFLGISVPLQREIAKKYLNLTFADISKLLKSNFHEERLVALLILVEKYKKFEEKEKRIIFDFYVKNLKGVNNWDLVDLSAPNIVGDFLLTNPSKLNLLYKLAVSKNLWERRIAIVATYSFIKRGQFIDALKISEILLADNHDLIHKASGWMLREVGKIDQKTLEKFLKKFSKSMPRTMLRYAIERFDEKKRKFYLRK